MAHAPPSVVAVAMDNRKQCMSCTRPINKGAAMVSVHPVNEWTGGFTKRYVHAKCFRSFRAGTDNVRLTKMMPAGAYDKLSLAGKADLNQAEQDFNAKIWDLFYQTSDALASKKLPKDVFETVLNKNGIEMRNKRQDLWIYMFADSLLNGLVPSCPVCKKRSLIYSGAEYECSGYMSATTRCPYRSVDAVQREKFLISFELSQSPFMDGVTPHPTLVAQEECEGGPDMDPNVPSEDEADADVPSNQELLGMTFFAAGALDITKKELQELIESHGGTYTTAITKATHVVSSEDELKKPKKSRNKSLSKVLASKTQLPVVTTEFVRDLAGRSGAGLKLRQRKHHGAYRIGGGEGNKTPPVRALLKSNQHDAASSAAPASSASATGPSAAQPAGSKKGKATKAAASADAATAPPSLARKATVLAGSQLLKVDSFAKVPKGAAIYVAEDNSVYNVMLNKTDVTTGTNKFYVIQLIKAGSSYYLFTRWGRVGDNSGVMFVSWGSAKPAYQLKRFGSRDGGIAAFAEKFYKQTGNHWNNGAAETEFEHQPGRYNMVLLEGRREEDGGTDSEAGKRKASEPSSAASGKRSKKELRPDSKLTAPVREFVKLIFDKDMMRKSLQQANIDIKKMPLGSLSRAQMNHGYDILKEIVSVLEGKTEVVNEDHRQALLVDATNRFYLAIPHTFPSYATVPVISSKEQLKQKLDLMETLLDISHANKLMLEAELDTSLNQDDANYSKLNCDLEPVDRSSEEFKMVETYVKNTHGSTHDSYRLHVANLFKAKRGGEEDRFKPWQSNPNRRLLWHGSRLTNWVGILSQGLRIAPPEAPVTGYMFGKGLYFANMVSKSANYCFASQRAPQGVLLLCEVALGDMMECQRSDSNAAENSKKKKKQSTWGQGMTTPNPAQAVSIEGGLNVPLGKGQPSGLSTALLYDEFIVYDVSQVKMRYVVQLDFKFR